MPRSITITRLLPPQAVAAPVVRWPANASINPATRAAIDAYTKEVERTLSALSNAVRELQSQLHQATVGGDAP